MRSDTGPRRGGGAGDPRPLAPDVVLLDLHMPRVNGFDVLEYLGRQPTDTRPAVIVMSASSDPIDMARAAFLGARRYLVKTRVEVDELCNHVEAVLSGRSAR
ncbi:MAG: response regulator [Tepidisphaeraceae bacterium]